MFWNLLKLFNISDLIIIIISTIYCQDERKCPADFFPCSCKLDYIVCGGVEDFNLKEKFKLLSENLGDIEKQFNSFYLYNTYINKIEENTFNGITFNLVDISNAVNLTKIDSDAFNGTELMVDTIYLMNLPKLMIIIDCLNFWQICNILMILQ